MITTETRDTKRTQANQRDGRATRPNFVFILADDLGYADLHCYGGRENCSPNLDRMAARGPAFYERLRQLVGLLAVSVCDCHRTLSAPAARRLRRADCHVSPALGLPPEHPTMASLLRDAGYATALIGKWHLGSLPWFSPLKSGYEEFFGHRTGAVDFFTHAGFGGHDLWEGDEEVFKEGYLTDLLTDRAVDFVRRSVGRKAVFALIALQCTALAMGNA